MKKRIIALALLIMGLGTQAQVGMNCQYVPGLQFGHIKVKTDNAALGTYKYSAGLPLMMIDRITNHWYVNMDMNGLYYAVTQTNKANSDKIKIAKTEGGYFSARLGYLWGKGDQFRVGGCFDLGASTSNLDSSKRALEPRAYTNIGLGIIVYKKLGKLRVAGKLGYEKLTAKSWITKGSNLYLEGTFAYSIFQKYGISIMPAWSSKKFAYTSKFTPKDGTSLTGTTINAKVGYFALRFGLTKFF